MMSKAPVWITFALLSCVACQMCVAAPTADFWEGQDLWVKVNETLSIQIQAEEAAAQQEKRASRRMELTDYAYVGFLEKAGHGVGWLPCTIVATRALLILRIQYPTPEHKVEDLEKKLRELWPKEFKPDRTGDYRALYTRYSAERKFKDALRIAEECAHDYAWTWNAREWQDWVITALSFDAELKDRMAGLIVAFSDSHRTELGAHAFLLRYLAYLQGMDLWIPAAHVANACVKTYRDCDWEPEFLAYALVANQHLVQGVFNASLNVASNKPVAVTSPATPERQATPALDPTKLLMELTGRCVTRYPYNPEVSAALLMFFKWSQEDAAVDGALREHAARTMAAYLAKYKHTPHWLGLWRVGQAAVAAGKAEWVALTGDAATEEANVPARDALVHAALKIDSITNRASYVEAMLATLAALPPDTVQAQAIVAALATQIMTPNWDHDVLTNSMTQVSRVISTRFPNRPSFRSVQLQRLGATGLAASTDIFKGLLEQACPPLQTEWYYYMNEKRFVDGSFYNLEAFHTYATKCKGSYFLPQELDRVCYWAWYNQRPDDASRACEIMTDKIYANSLLVANMFANNISAWLPSTLSKEASDLKAGKGSKAPKKPATDANVIRVHSESAGLQANMIDRAQGDKINLGAFYYNAIVGGNTITFAAHRNLTAKKILHSNEYRDSFFYFFSRADDGK